MRHSTFKCSPCVFLRGQDSDVYMHINPAPLPRPYQFFAARRNRFHVPTPTVRVSGEIPHRLFWKNGFGLGGNQVGG